MTIPTIYTATPCNSVLVSGNNKQDASKFLDRLAKNLGETPLDPTFEKYGCFSSTFGPFLYPTPIFEQYPGLKDFEGCLHLFGNFSTVSHSFTVIIKDKAQQRHFLELLLYNVRHPSYRKEVQAMVARGALQESDCFFVSPVYGPVCITEHQLARLETVKLEANEYLAYLHKVITDPSTERLGTRADGITLGTALDRFAVQFIFNNQ